MVPFISDTLELILRKLMRIFSKKDLLQNASTSYELIKIHVAGEKPKTSTASTIRHYDK